MVVNGRRWRGGARRGGAGTTRQIGKWRPLPSRFRASDPPSATSDEGSMADDGRFV